MEGKCERPLQIKRIRVEQASVKTGGGDSPRLLHLSTRLSELKLTLVVTCETMSISISKFTIVRGLMKSPSSNGLLLSSVYRHESASSCNKDNNTKAVEQRARDEMRHKCIIQHSLINLFVNCWGNWRGWLSWRRNLFACFYFLFLGCFLSRTPHLLYLPSPIACFTHPIRQFSLPIITEPSSQQTKTTTKHHQRRGNFSLPTYRPRSPPSKLPRYFHLPLTNVCFFKTMNL